MPSSLSSTTLTQLCPLLGSLARLMARGAALNDAELQMLLMGVELENDPAALAELQRWGRLLNALQHQPTLRQITVETLLLRGLPEAPILLAVATVIEGLPASPSPPATTTTASTPDQLQVHPASLDFGTLAPDQPVVAYLTIQGGPGHIVVESDYLHIAQRQFGAAPTRVSVEARPLAGGVLWTSLKLVTANATVDVPVIAQWAAASAPQPGVTLVVTPGASEDEAGVRLVEAVAAAPAGGVLHVAAGTYRLAQPLVVHKPLTLTGEGQDQTRLLCAAEAYVAHLTGDGPFVVADLSFVHVGTAWASVVQVSGGVIDIQRCCFTGGVFDATSHRGGSGLALGGQTGGLVRQCEVRGNATYGIYVGDQAQPTLEANTCQQNQQSGIGYGGSAGGTARQNTCTGNTKHGISVTEQAQPTLEANTCQQNQESGIAYRDSAGGTARQNTCT
ncbi:right-handed parallel beta-helix repeat-containing protein, partial [Candidatus Chloroploca sp. M-50]